MTKILIIEDSEPLRNDILEMLSFEGFEVMGAENGAVGVEFALRHHPDLIICDIMMPELSGYEVLEVLRKDQRTVTTPFIFLTAKTDRIDMRRGMGLGADDYLMKPFIASELLETIHTRLQKQEALADITQHKLNELSNSIMTALPHELRTPLNTILGFSDMFMTEAHRLSPEEIAEWGGHIQFAAQRLYRLVENYLIYVRTEVIEHNAAQLAELKRHSIDYPDTIVQFHAIQKAQQVGRDDDFEVRGSEENIRVRISDSDLGKIVEELVDNALKFSEPGEKVRVVTSVEKGHYVLNVVDHGRGMSSEQVDSLGVHRQFDRWFYEQQGIGLGLAIVRRLVELHEGQFSIQSELGEGTCAIIRLPLV